MTVSPATLSTMPMGESMNSDLWRRGAAGAAEAGAAALRAKGARGFRHVDACVLAGRASCDDAAARAVHALAAARHVDNSVGAAAAAEDGRRGSIAQVK